MNYITLQPSGQFDGDSVNSLRQEVVQAMSQGEETILIDCQNISFMNSSAIGALVSILKTVQAQEKALILCGLKPQVRMVFELTRMDDVFQIYESREEFESQQTTPVGN